jgi:hypothetical protein
VLNAAFTCDAPYDFYVANCQYSNFILITSIANALCGYCKQYYVPYTIKAYTTFCINLATDLPKYQTTVTVLNCAKYGADGTCKECNSTAMFLYLYQ